MLYIVMELMTGGDLFDVLIDIGHLSEASTAKDMCHITQGLEYLHDREIVHRDLKPENLLYSRPLPEGVLKISDFGIAEVAWGGIDDIKGTPGYMAPEILEGEMPTTQADMWSLGVIIYMLLVGFPPFYHSDIQDHVEGDEMDELTFDEEEWESITMEAQDVVRQLLVVDQERRLTASQLLDIPWIQGIGAPAEPLHREHDTCDKHVTKLAKFKKRGWNSLRRSVMSIRKLGSVRFEADDLGEAV